MCGQDDKAGFFLRGQADDLGCRVAGHDPHAYFGLAAEPLFSQPFKRDAVVLAQLLFVGYDVEAWDQRTVNRGQRYRRGRTT